MSKSTRWSIKDMQDKKLVEVDGIYVPIASQVAKRVDKIETGIPFGINHQPLGNKKIKNAVKSEVNGVKFDSNLEKYMYGLLKASHIEFEFQKEYMIQEKFRYGTEAIRAITLTVDFWLPTRNMLVDSKGFQTHDGKVRWKLLKLKLCRQFGGNVPSIEMPSTKKECDLLLNRLLYGQP